MQINMEKTNFMHMTKKTVLLFVSLLYGKRLAKVTSYVTL